MTLSQTLRTTIGRNLKNWLDCLPYVEFAYNRAVHSGTKRSPFEVVYGFNPPTPMEFTPIPLGDAISLEGEDKAEYVKRLHAETKANLEKQNIQNTKNNNKGRRHVVFNEGDWVWLHLRPERFPHRRKSKLAPRGDGPFRVLRRINDNAYQLELPGEDFALETKALQEGGNDEDIVPAIAPIIPPGPMTRSKRKALGDKLAMLMDAKGREEPEEIAPEPSSEAKAHQGPFKPDKEQWRFLHEDSSSSGVFTIAIR